MCVFSLLFVSLDRNRISWLQNNWHVFVFAINKWECNKKDSQHSFIRIGRNVVSRNLFLLLCSPISDNEFGILCKMQMERNKQQS